MERNNNNNYTMLIVNVFYIIQYKIIIKYIFHSPHFQCFAQGQLVDLLDTWFNL